MRYRDIIQDMKRHGRYGEADELERAVERSGSTWDRVSTRHDARDGLSFMSYAGDQAERAYDNIRYEERREEERHEEEARRERWEEEQAAQRRRQAEQEEYEYYARQQEAEQQQQEGHQ